MVIDSSAFIAILEDEPESRAFRSAVTADQTRIASTATIVETAIVVLAKRGEAGLSALRDLISAADIVAAAVGADQVDIAVEAFRRFGKGRHPAGPNFGDCFSYALSMATGEPLLYKGRDFSRTDVKAAVLP